MNPNRFRILVVALACAAPAARGQSLQALPSFALERIALDPAAIGSLALGSGETLERGTLRLSTALHYERNPLLAYRDGVRVASVVNNRFTVHLFGAYGVTDRVQLGFELPIVPRQAGDDLAQIGYQRASEGGLATPFLSARVALLRRDDGFPVDLAGELGVGLPIGSGGSLAASDGFSAVPKVLASRKLGPIFASAELGTELRKSVVLGPSRVGSQLDFGASAATDEVVERLRLELTVRGTTPYTNIPVAFELLAGARYHVLPFLEVFVLGGPGLRATPGVPAWRLLLGVGLTRAAPAPAPIAEIAPPPPAPVAEPPPDAIAVPAPPVDPCAPGEKHEPAQCPLLDDDGDGVPNQIDNCPTTPGPSANQGCPVAQKQLVIIRQRLLELKEKLFFDSGRATIQKRSLGLLDQVASVLGAHPELPQLVIEGHTDDRGKAEVNRKLSRTRAEAVLAYLVKKGIAPARMSAVGFGPDRPLVNTRTARSRAANRRVEFRLEGAPPAVISAVPVAPATAAAAAPIPTPAPTPTPAAATTPASALEVKP
jgi:outer membrane protein OmpA-like peptidoglycan-associated protein